MNDYFDNSDTMGGSENWPTMSYNQGLLSCGPDEEPLFSSNIYQWICKPKLFNSSGHERDLENAYIRRIGGLGYWNASTAPIIVSGGGNPQYHGTYQYAGHYWGLPFYQKGNYYIYFGGAWQLFDGDMRYSAYVGSGPHAYPNDATGWISSFGTVSNVPTFSRGSGGGTTAIPRWPVMEPAPPGPAPWEDSWYQQDYVYDPDAYYSQWSSPFNPDPIHTMNQYDYPAYMGGRVPGEALTYNDNYVENLVPREGDPRYLGPPIRIDGTKEPKPLDPSIILPPVYQDSPPNPAGVGGVLQDFEGALSDAVGGTIFGFSPLMVLGVGAVALFLFSGKK